MYRILIVDDEYLVRRSLIQRIQTLSSDYELMESGDSENALYICAQWKPHIVIADISMPMMDGLTMIEHMKRANSSAQFLILSGYAEFPLAQKALHLGVVEYLVKPVDNDSLSRALLKCVNMVSDSESRSELSQQHERLVNNLRSLNRQMDFMYLLDASEDTPTHELELLHSRLFQDKASMYVLALLRASTSSVSEMPRDWLMQTVSRSLPRTEKMPYLFSHLNDRRLYCVFTLNSVNELQNVRECLNSLIAAASEMGTPLIAGLSLPLPSISSTAKIQASDALRQRLLFDNECIYEYTYAHNPLQQTELQNELEKLQRALENGNSASAKNSVMNIFSPPLNVEMHYINRAYFGVMSILFNLLSVDEPTPKVSTEMLDIFWDKDEFIRYLFDLIDSTVHCSSGANASAMPRVQMAIDYINNHYNEDIALNDLCTQYAISVSYFSNLLKKKVGCSLINYITKLRIENTCYLLQNTPLSVSDIACRVGYQDVRYFFRVFKKHMGVTPMQYRKQFAPDDGDEDLD